MFGLSKLLAKGVALGTVVLALYARRAHRRRRVRLGCTRHQPLHRRSHFKHEL